MNGDRVGALDGYVDDSLWRFLHTWDMVRKLEGTCLEIGANPYFTTYLLQHFSQLGLTLTNYYGHTGQVTETLSFLRPGDNARTEIELHSRMLNVETEKFPFDSESFDVVLFCETIEHLLMDPVAALREIHRVLKPSGVLILTTPNVARLQNVLTLVAGGNVYDPYSGFGPYGRHNREYTTDELQRLLAFCGFTIERAFTADGHPWDPTAWPHYEDVAPFLRIRQEQLGQYLFVRARPAGQAAQGLPEFLYRSYPPEKMARTEA